eukprot:sb/3475598/
MYQFSSPQRLYSTEEPFIWRNICFLVCETLFSVVIVFRALLTNTPLLQDTQRSPLRRSALRNVTQDRSVRKRRLKKQVSFAEVLDRTEIFERSLQSPPPYEQIAAQITNRRHDEFFDARGSFSIR